MNIIIIEILDLDIVRSWDGVFLLHGFAGLGLGFVHADVLVHYAAETHAHVFVLAVHLPLLEVESCQILAVSADDHQWLANQGLGELILEDSEHQLFLLALGFALVGGAVEQTLLRFFEGIEEDVGE